MYLIRVLKYNLLHKQLRSVSYDLFALNRMSKIEKVSIFKQINKCIHISTLEFQIDHTVGKNLHGWKNDIDNGARATEM